MIENGALLAYILELQSPSQTADLRKEFSIKKIKVKWLTRAVVNNKYKQF